MGQITKKDVLIVASALKYSELVTDNDVQYVLDNYESASANDPSATWDLLVEQLLFEALN